MKVKKDQTMYSLPTHAANHGGWQSRLKILLAENNHQKSNGRGNLSYQSQSDRSDRLFRIFNTLTKVLKFGIEDPANLKPKHIQAIIEFWVEKKLSAATIENYLTILRLFCKWINKRGMVKSLSDYAPGMKRTYAAQVDRSPQFNGADFWRLWDEVSQKDGNVGRQLLLVMAFGARRKEAVMFMPLIHDKGLYVELVSGTKNGKARTVPIDSELKREVLCKLKKYVSEKYGYGKAHIGHPEKTLAQNLKRYSYILGACGLTKDDLGFTGHGFRQEYMIEQLAKRGVVATIRGGSGQAMTKLETEVAYLQVSDQAGHSRTSVMTAYAGARRKT
ncbi:MAG: integrase domain-containing protein [Burkholderiaceae bacterium]|nr:integrase domain-containing protein [Burkholderiaceae bacterium]